MAMESLLERISQNANCKRICELISDGQKLPKIILKGLSGSAKSFTMASTFAQTRQMICAILPDKESASYFYDDLVSILGDEDVMFYPSAFKRSVEYMKENKSSIVLQTEVLTRLNTTRKGFIMVAYPEAIMEKVIRTKELTRNTLSISVGDNLPMEKLIDMLNDWNFSRDDFVFEPGSYAVRGSLIDVFSYGAENPYRIDFDDDTIEKIREFNPETQGSTEKLHKVRIIPNFYDKQTVEERISFFEFMNREYSLWIDSPGYVLESIKKSYELAEVRYSELSDKEILDEETYIINPKSNLIDKENFISSISTLPTVEISSRSYFSASDELQFDTEPQPAFSKQFELVIANVKEKNNNGYKVFIYSNNEKQLQRIEDIFNDAQAENETNTSQSYFYPVVKSLHEGFVDNESKTCVYTDHQIFERYHRYTTKNISKTNAMTFQELSELHIGDYIVHVDNGIGRFGGLQKITRNGHEQEVVKLIYGENDILFVNIHSLHRISKYRDKDGEPPTIHRLGSGHWKRLKERTKKNIKDIARDLILLYAKRREQKGFAFSPDTYMQVELESSFMYEDTPDQSKTNELIKADMESEIPMDRLICGDVGFGKTELAIRAAFKAVTDGKQVAVLVPTTILALQHFQTFSDRLKNLPVTVSYISRLKSAKEIKETLANLKSGKIDIIIGTHKLVGKNVDFKDLGLLIVDEEQKFGVAVKEKIKQMKVNIDTLTLTATPIPRTLQFSLMGARDLSVISTPPPNRQPVTTELHAFNNDIIRDAIYYEVGRNGQVFFVHNRIQNIYEVQNQINKICPEVKTVVAHGQMEGEQLEKIILEFMRGDYDVLICTSIVENGVDIPNANTIIINNANNFGLSDLHQLRGRVGRSNKKAFCYLLTPPLSALTPDARRRLKAIEEFSELGSGINIALQDLDIRGAGNILGGEQSGFIADIGFETYNKILNEAISELKETEFHDVFKDEDDTPKPAAHDCQMETDLYLIIPDYYISSTSERIKLYRQIDELKNEAELEKFRYMLIDRFGKIPDETEGMFAMVRLRWTAMQLGFQKIAIKNNVFLGYFPQDQKSEYYSSKLFISILQFVQDNPRRLTVKQHDDRLILRLEGISSLPQIVAFMEGLRNSVLGKC